MTLCLLRHGKSPSLSEAGVSRDFDRPLSAQGRADVRRAAERLKKNLGVPARILSSPLVRALESANAAAEVLGTRVEEFGPLDNRLGPSELWDALRGGFGSEASVLAVGHLPQLADLVAHLTGESVELKPGGVAVLEIGEEKVRILWTQNP